MKLVEVDLERCIGCQLCARYCPWETIDMWGYEEGIALAPSQTVRSLIYEYDPERCTRRPRAASLTRRTLRA